MPLVEHVVVLRLQSPLALSLKKASAASATPWPLALEVDISKLYATREHTLPMEKFILGCYKIAVG
jgi:hypothetical protein